MSSRGMPITKAMRAERRARAEKMHEEYNKLSIQEKLDRLPPGGANKQRAKLEAQLKAPQEKTQQKQAQKKE